MNIHAHETPAGFLFWQAALFSGAAALLIILTVWWFYLSPIRRTAHTPAPPSSRLAGWLAALLGAATLAWLVGMLWDASMHIQTGEIPSGADFLWPPHLLLYSGFLLAFLVAAVVVAQVAVRGWRRGQRDPRAWVRDQPYLGAVALASLYELLAIPGDALWHELFGEDLTAWSPPHVLLVLMMAVVILCTVGVLLQSRPGERRRGWQPAAVVVLAGMMLNLVYILAVLEWELPARSPLVLARPLWAYPLAGGAAAFFTFVLVRWLVDFRWAATATAAVFYLVRLGITAGLDLSNNVAPATPLLFVLGAVLLDVLPVQRVRRKPARWLVIAAAFTLGYAALTFPQLAGRDDLPGLTTVDFALALLLVFAVSLVLVPVASLLARRLGGDPAQIGAV